MTSINGRPIELGFPATTTALKSSSPSGMARAFAVSALMAVATATPAVTVDVVATGLDSPRGIAIGPAGRILVIEAGAGGVTPTMTGHVTELFKGKVRRLLTLPSVFVSNGEISGPTSIAVPTGLGHMLVTMGAGPNPPFGDLLRANPALTSFIADIELHEWTHNPDGVVPPDSNPYGVAVVGDGSKLVADAAANTLLQVDHDGAVHTVAVFPGSIHCSRPARHVHWRSREASRQVSPSAPTARGTSAGAGFRLSCRRISGASSQVRATCIA
jgi:hypothetical protein